MTEITRISELFTRRWRASLIALIAILLFGTAAYLVLLRREGFPPVEFPASIIQAGYIVDDREKVLKDVTIPIEKELAKISEIASYSSTTDKNFTFFLVNYETGTTSSEGNALVKEQINNAGVLPKAAGINFNEISAASLDGENDLSFFIAQPGLSQAKLEKVASKLVAEIEDLDRIVSADVKPLFSTQVNPFTGQSQKIETDFSRIAYREDGELKFLKAIPIGIKLKADTDIIEFSTDLRAAIKAAQTGKDAPISKDIVLDFSGDIADGLQEQIGSLESNTISGLVIIIIIALLFINWRAAVVAAIFIPTVLAGTFLGLYLTGNTLNVISLFGLILVLGLFVDDVIVVIEAIDYEKKRDKKGIEAMKAAINKVGVADALGTLTTMIVFAPMLAIGGVLGDFITLIPLTVILALGISLTLALTIFTWLGTLIIPDTSKGKVGVITKALNYPNKLVSKVGQSISQFVGYYLRNPYLTALVIVVSLGLIGLGGATAQNLKFDIFPTAKDADEISINITYPEDTSIKNAKRIATVIENKVTDTAPEEILSAAYILADNTEAQLSISLTSMGSRDITAKEITDAINLELEDYKPARAKATVTSAGPPSSDFQFQLQVFNNNSKVLKKAVNNINDYLLDTFEYIPSEGADPIMIAETSVSGLDATTRKDGQRFGQIQLRFDSDSITSGDIQQVQTNLEKYFSKKRLAKLGLEVEELTFDQGIESENFESFQDVGLAFIIALVVMYALLVLMFNSYTQPLLVFLAIPFGFIGMFPGLYFTNNGISFFVMIGLLALAGIVVNNTIMLMEYVNQAKRSGKTTQDAITEAIGVRFRPLATTSVTTIAGLLPLAISDPFWEGLAFTIIFGLASSTIMVLTAFPAYYYVAENLRKWTASGISRILAASN